MSLLAVTGAAHANPQGGEVVGGSASFETAPNKLTIRQTTQKAVIDWRSFDINGNEHTQFIQPNSSSLTVNRIRDTKPSQIDGRLSANGRLVLINPNGVVYGAGAKVDVGGLVTSTADVDTDEVMNSDLIRFTTPGNIDAKIINRGHITAKEAGLIGFVAPQIENHGVIEARLGKVQLASGEKATLDFAGDGLIAVAVDKDTLQQKVINTGRISADGGTIQLAAADARQTVDALISNNGTLEARSVGVKNGKIILSAGGAHKTAKAGKSRIENSGKIDVSGKGKYQKGGTVTATADELVQFSGSVIDASGYSGGGTIRLGGEYQGGGTMQTAMLNLAEAGSVIDASAINRGNGGEIILWADGETGFDGKIRAKGGKTFGNGGFVEVSGAEHLIYNGHVDTSAANGVYGTLLLDPTNITISNAANAAVTGSTTFTPNADDATSNLNITTLQNTLASSSVTVSTRATGSQAGTITVVDPIAWTSSRTLTLSAHSDIIINGDITGRNINLESGGDVQLNANLSTNLANSGALAIYGRGTGLSIGLGDGAAGTILLSNTELDRIQDGWGSLNFGRTNDTANIDVRAYAFKDALTFRNNTGTTSVNGNISAQGNIAFYGDSLDINGDVSAAGFNLYLYTGNLAANNTSIGIGDGTSGTLHLSNAEFAHLQDGFSAINVGSNASTYNGTIELGTLTWLDPVTISSAMGHIGVKGQQTLGGGTTLQSTTIDIAAPITGAASLTLRPYLAATSFGAGDNAVGTYNLTNAELDNLQGLANLYLGFSGLTADSDYRAYNWRQRTIFYSGDGAININGDQNFGTSSFALQGNIANINYDLIGSGGALELRPSTPGTSIGVGDGMTGTFNLTDAELNHIVNGWGYMNIGNTNITGGMNVGARTWMDTVYLYSLAPITFHGAQTMGESGLTFSWYANDFGGVPDVINASHIRFGLLGTGTLGIGDGATGTVNISNAAIADIQNRAAGSITFHSDSNMDITAQSWNKQMTFDSGAGITISGAQNFNTYNTTFQMVNDIVINADMSGTGSIRFTNPGSSNRTISIAGTGGNIDFTTAELDHLLDGFSTIYFGANNSTSSQGLITLGAYTWKDALYIERLNSAITVSGAQTMGANSLVLETNIGLNLNADLIGTGSLTIRPESSAGQMHIGTGSGLVLNDAALNRIIDGWSLVQFGHSGSTPVMNINTARTWTDSIQFINGGGYNITAAQNFGNNAVAFYGDSFNLGANISGTNSLSIRNLAAATAFNLGAANESAQTGIILTATELNRIQDGFSSILFGGSSNYSHTGNINVSAYTWKDPFQLYTETGTINFNGAQNFGNNSVSITTRGNVNFNAAMTGTNTMSITPQSSTSSMCVGTTGCNSNISGLNNLTDGWSNLYFGRSGTGTATGSLFVGATTWRDNVEFRNRGASIFVNGQQNFVNANGAFRSDGEIRLNADLIGNFGMTFYTMNAATDMNIANGILSGMYLTSYDLGHIKDGFSQINFGASSSAHSGTLRLGAADWTDSVQLYTNTGNIDISGAQNVGSNNFSIISNGSIVINAPVTGTGAFTLQQQNTSTVLALNAYSSTGPWLRAADLDNISDGWSSLTFGRSDGAGINLYAYSNWRDDVEFRGEGDIVVHGTQNFGNNLVTFNSNSDYNIDAALNGTGVIRFTTPSGVDQIRIGGAEATGVGVLTTAELDLISSNFNKIRFGNTAHNGGIEFVTPYTWRNDVDIWTNTGIIRIAGDQNFGSHNLSISTNADLDLSANIAGTGEFALLSSNDAATLVLGGTGGNVNLTTAELNRISNGWSALKFGKTAMTGAMTLNAATWNDDTQFVTGTGIITIAGAQNANSNNMVFETGADLIIDAAVNGTGDLYIRPRYNDLAGTIGLGGESGTINLSDAELDFLGSGWDEVTFGRTGMTGNLRVGGYTGWKNNVRLLTDTGIVTFSATQDFGAHNLIIESNADSVIGGPMSGNIFKVISQAGDKILGIGGESGDILFSDAEISRLSGWDVINFGDTLQTADIRIGEVAFKDKTTFRTNGDIYLTGDITSDESGDAFTFVGGSFQNSAGADAINPGTGRYLVYSATPAHDHYDGLNRATKRYNKTYSGYAPDSVTETGNVFLYAVAPTLNVKIDDKTRDYGYNDPAFTYTVLSGLIDGDDGSDISGTYSSGAVATSNAGTTHAITAALASALGYTLNVTNGTLTIEKADVVIKADNKEREYGLTNPGFTATITGLRNNETESVFSTGYSFSTGAVQGSDVGHYAITAGGASASNYNISYEAGDLEVKKATATIKVDDKTREYGLSNPAFTTTITGLRNNDTESVFDVGYTYNTGAVQGSDVGHYAVTAGGASDNNYNFVYQAGDLEITKATATIKVDDKTREYGLSNPGFTTTITGLRNNDTESVFDVGYTYNTGAVQGSDVGHYAVTAGGASDNNYNFIYQAGDLNITKATVTVKADNKTREYGLTNPAFTTTVTGLRNNDTESVFDVGYTVSSNGTQASNVGHYAITAGGASDNNYNFVYQAGDLDITKADITVTADNKVREYGLNNPAFTATITGLRNNDTASVLDVGYSFSTGANQGTDVGHYGITVGGASDNNYNIYYVAGDLEIIKADVYVKANSYERLIGTANPVFDYTLIGGRNGQVNMGIDGLIFTTLATTGSNQGNYAIVASNGTSTNYNILGYVDGNLNIFLPPPVPVTTEVKVPVPDSVIKQASSVTPPSIVTAGNTPAAGGISPGNSTTANSNSGGNTGGGSGSEGASDDGNNAAGGNADDLPHESSTFEDGPYGQAMIAPAPYSFSPEIRKFYDL
jgi:filamentous hemagglutinin family protein